MNGIGEEAEKPEDGIEEIVERDQPEVAGQSGVSDYPLIQIGKAEKSNSEDEHEERCCGRGEALHDEKDRP
jgi:hypothetical protein